MALHRSPPNRPTPPLGPALVPTILPREEAPRGATVTARVYLQAGAGLTPCLARECRATRIWVDGRIYEHVADAPDGTWIYGVRVS